MQAQKIRSQAAEIAQYKQLRVIERREMEERLSQMETKLQEKMDDRFREMEERFKKKMADAETQYSTEMDEQELTDQLIEIIDETEEQLSSLQGSIMDGVMSFDDSEDMSVALDRKFNLNILCASDDILLVWLLSYMVFI